MVWLVAFLAVAGAPHPAGAGPATIWVVNMPHEPALELRGSLDQQRAELIARSRQLVEHGITGYTVADAPDSPQLILKPGILANTESELEEDPGFAAEVLGQKGTFRTIARFAAQANPLQVRLRFLPWSRALREIVQSYHDLVEHSHDVMITQVPSSWCAYLANKEILTPLSQGTDRSLFSEKTLRWYTWRSELYAIPCLVDMRFLFYNADKYSDADFTSQDRFLAALRREKLKSSSRQGVPIGIPTSVGFDSFHLLANLFYDSGEVRFVEQSNWQLFTWEKATLDSSPAMRVIDLLAQMRWEGLLEASPITARDAAAKFLSGDYDMILQGSWVVNQYNRQEKKRFKLGVALPPDLGNGRHVYEGGSGYGLGTSARSDPDAAVIARAFIREQALRDPENELPATKDVQAKSKLFRAVTGLSGWSPQASFVYPISPAWAASLEDQPLSSFFWANLESITPTAAPASASERERLGRDQAGLRSRMTAINEDINDHLTEGAKKKLGLWNSAYVAVAIVAAICFLIGSAVRHEEKKVALQRAEAAHALERALRIQAEAERRSAEDQQIANQKAAGILAHRLRGTLVNVSAALGWVVNGKYPSAERNAELVVAAKNGVAEAAAIIDRFRQFARAQRYELSTTVPAEKLLQSMKETVANTLTRADVAVSSCADSGLPCVKVNEARLRENFSNFAENAQRNESCHEICLSAELASRDEAVGVGLSAERSYVKLICQDDGPGVRQEIKETIFEPFFSEAVEGSGLGLAMCRLDMQIHQGAVVERGEPGKGARFELFLPAVSDSG